MEGYMPPSSHRDHSFFGLRYPIGRCCVQLNDEAGSLDGRRALIDAYSPVLEGNRTQFDHIGSSFKKGRHPMESLASPLEGRGSEMYPRASSFSRHASSMKSCRS
jgi:hypothetical protein